MALIGIGAFVGLSLFFAWLLRTRPCAWRGIVQGQAYCCSLPAGHRGRHMAVTEHGARDISKEEVR